MKIEKNKSKGFGFFLRRRTSPRMASVVFLKSLLLAVLLLAGCREAPDGARGNPDEVWEEPTGIWVADVIDGDTVELSDGTRVRYLGINTPERMKKKSGKWVLAPEEFAVEAKKYNESLVRSKNVRLEYDVVKKDKYGRTLAYVYTDNDVLVNAEIVKRGYSLVYTIPPNVRYMDVLLTAQEEARRGKKGLWRSQAAISAKDAAAHFGKIRVIKGMVTGTYVSAGNTFLKFGKDKEKTLTAVIYTRNLRFFTEKDIIPSVDYAGKYVEIIGKIEDKFGPKTIIDNPSQIRVIEAAD